MTDIADKELEVVEVGRMVLAEANENGHDMLHWKPVEFGVGLGTGCRKCGQGLYVKHEGGVVTVKGCNLSPCPDRDIYTEEATR